jgi:hypothetical protein
MVSLDGLVTTNLPVNKDRLSLYKRMVKTDRLPPLVLRPAPGGRVMIVVDGNHRYAAAKSAGMKELEAFILPAVPPRGTKAP